MEPAAKSNMDTVGAGLAMSSDQFEQYLALGRQALHAALLGFAHPSSDETLLFESDPPSDFAALQDQLSRL